LTASTAVALLILLAVEDVTVVRVRLLLTPHVVRRMLHVPPVPVLRLLGPILAVLVVPLVSPWLSTDHLGQP
jgi:hypothetical protein